MSVVHHTTQQQDDQILAQVAEIDEDYEWLEMRAVDRGLDRTAELASLEKKKQVLLSGLSTAVPPELEGEALDAQILADLKAKLAARATVRLRLGNEASYYYPTIKMLEAKIDMWKLAQLEEVYGELEMRRTESVRGGHIRWMAIFDTKLKYLPTPKWVLHSQHRVNTLRELCSRKFIKGELEEIPGDPRWPSDLALDNQQHAFYREMGQKNYEVMVANNKRRPIKA